MGEYSQTWSLHEGYGFLVCPIVLECFGKVSFSGILDGFTAFGDIAEKGPPED